MEIDVNKYVSVTYDLNVGEEGNLELMESATADKPLNFIFGLGMMLPAFEDGLKGLKVGDDFSLTLTPENAYGNYDQDYVLELEKAIFEVNGKFDSEMIVEGNLVPMMDSNGNRRNGLVLEVKDNVVVMDFNHPLAGETLHFSGKVIEVHEATAEEIAAVTSASGCGGCDCDSCGGGCSGGEDSGSCGCGGCH